MISLGKDLKILFRGLLFLVIFIGCVENVRAQNAKSKNSEGCFDIINLRKERPSEILLNRCTGESWMLFKLDFNPSDNKADKSKAVYAYMWGKLAKSDKVDMLIKAE